MKVKNMELCYNLFLNASRRRNGEVRSNTWNITVVIQNDSVLKNTDELYLRLESALDYYQNKILNDTIPFDCMEPELGNMGNFFADRFGAVAESYGCILKEVRVFDSVKTGVIVKITESN